MSEQLSYALMAGMAIIAGMSYLFGYSAGSKRDVPVKRVNYDLNAAHADASKLRAGLIRIRNHFAGQKSGSAVKAHRMAKEALK